MKLIFCLECADVVLLRLLPEGEYRSCDCGQSKGRYINNVDAEIFGSAVPIGFANRSFSLAVMSQPESGEGESFTAFVIPKECPTVVKKGEK